MPGKKLRIAILHLAFVYSGGGERLVLEEAKGLSDLGYEVTVFSPVVSAKDCYPTLLKKIPVRQIIPLLPRIIPERESFQIILACLLAPVVAFQFKEFDIILAANQPSPWLAFWAKKIFGIPYISYLAQPTRFIYPRKVDQENGLIFVRRRLVSWATILLKATKMVTKTLDIQSIRFSDRILTNGGYIKRLIDRVYCIKSISCPGGAYPSRKIPNYKIRKVGELRIAYGVIKKPYVLLTNRHFPQKRFEYAITILPALIEACPNIKLVITGRKTFYSQDLEKLIGKLGLGEKILFVNHVDENELDRLYANALAYLYTAPEEDFGMGIVEAMAHATPVVAWNNAGPKWIIKNGVTGFLAKTDDISDYSSQVIKLLRDPVLASKIGKGGYLSVVKKYNYETHFRTIEENIRKSLKP